MTRRAFREYKEFWGYYVGEHRRPLTRRLHFAGTTGAILCVVATIYLGNAWLLALAPVIAYGLAWAGHHWVERNAPATLQYPLWSLIADLQMYVLMVAGKMDDEVRRHVE